MGDTGVPAALYASASGALAAHGMSAEAEAPVAASIEEPGGGGSGSILTRAASGDAGGGPGVAPAPVGLMELPARTSQSEVTILPDEEGTAAAAAPESERPETVAAEPPPPSPRFEQERPLEAPWPSTDPEVEQACARAASVPTDKTVIDQVMPGAGSPSGEIAKPEPLQLTVIVPEGAVAGVKLACIAPNGQELRLTLPTGVPVGSVMTLTQDPETKAWSCMADPAEAPRQPNTVPQQPSCSAALGSSVSTGAAAPAGALTGPAGSPLVANSPAPPAAAPGPAAAPAQAPAAAPPGAAAAETAESSFVPPSSATTASPGPHGPPLPQGPAAAPSGNAPTPALMGRNAGLNAAAIAAFGTKRGAPMPTSLRRDIVARVEPRSATRVARANQAALASPGQGLSQTVRAVPSSGSGAPFRSQPMGMVVAPANGPPLQSLKAPTTSQVADRLVSTNRPGVSVAVSAASKIPSYVAPPPPPPLAQQRPSWVAPPLPQEPQQKTSYVAPPQTGLQAPSYVDPLPSAAALTAAPSIGTTTAAPSNAVLRFASPGLPPPPGQSLTSQQAAVVATTSPTMPPQAAVNQAMARMALGMLMGSPAPPGASAAPTEPLLRSWTGLPTEAGPPPVPPGPPQAAPSVPPPAPSGPAAARRGPSLEPCGASKRGLSLEPPAPPIRGYSLEPPVGRRQRSLEPTPHPSAQRGFSLEPPTDAYRAPRGPPPSSLLLGLGGAGVDLGSMPVHVGRRMPQAPQSMPTRQLAHAGRSPPRSLPMGMHGVQRVAYA